MKVSLKSLDRDIVKLLVKIGAFADRQGVEIYLVGGAVRDVILKRQTVDIDLVTEANAITFGRKLSKYLQGEFLAHKKFGTATIRLASGQRIDLVTARSETYQHPGALPRVKLGDLRADAYRRDFTINALALFLNTSRFGEVVDHTGGLADLENGKIRVLHDQSFKDDPTRIFRAARYEQRYQFQIERRTLRLIKSGLESGVFNTISLQRYQNEINKIFQEQNPVSAIKRLHQWKVFAQLHPDLRIRWSVLVRLQKNVFLKIYPGNWECIAVPSLYWLGLLGGNASEVVTTVRQRMPFTKEQRKQIGELERLSELRKDLMRERVRPSQTCRVLKGFSEEALCYLWEITRNFSGRSNIQRYLEVRDM